MQEEAREMWIVDDVVSPPKTRRPAPLLLPLLCRECISGRIGRMS